jgi:hypothetical protein
MATFRLAQKHGRFNSMGGTAGDTDTGADHHLHPLDQDGRPHRRDQPFGQGLGLRDVTQPGQKRRELVAPQATQHIRAAQCSQQTLGGHLKQHIARVVAGGVVDIFEVVQVDEHQGGQSLVGHGILDSAPKCFLEEVAIGQLGQAVVVSESIEPALRRSSLTDFDVEIALPDFDALQHLVEAMRQASHFVVGLNRGAQAVVILAGDPFG